MQYPPEIALHQNGGHNLGQFVIRRDRAPGNTRRTSGQIAISTANTNRLPTDGTMDIWSEHKCVPPRGRVVEIAGTVFRHCRCELCHRDFIEVAGSGERCAVNVSAFDFIRLAREVSDRWLNEPCPKRHQPSDAEDRLKLA
jgi:hypothetical protein